MDIHEHTESFRQGVVGGSGVSVGVILLTYGFGNILIHLVEKIGWIFVSAIASGLVKVCISEYQNYKKYNKTENNEQSRKRRRSKKTDNERAA